MRTGFYGQGKQVQASTVTGAITVVGATNALAFGTNPTKILGSDKLAPFLQLMLDGLRKADPPSQKKLPVEVDVPEYIASVVYKGKGTALGRAISDLSLVTLYYLLRMGEYTTRSLHGGSK